MDTVLHYINNHILFICIFTYIWFAIDCIKFKRFLLNKIDWGLYIMHASCVTFSLYSFSSNNIFKGLGL